MSAFERFLKRAAARLEAAALNKAAEIEADLREAVNDVVGDVINSMPTSTTLQPAVVVEAASVTDTSELDMKKFFATIRSHMRGGKLNATQVKGMEAIIASGAEYCNAWIAYVLATADHETGQRFYAVREGFGKSNAASVRAVTALYNKGRISTNYALPTGPYGLNYYGRGLVQLTWLENYEKTSKQVGIDLVKYPDRMLDLDISVKAIWAGMLEGTYRKHSLQTKLPSTVRPTDAQWRSARNIINGDTRRNGTMIANTAKAYYAALESAS